MARLLTKIASIYYHFFCSWRRKNYKPFFFLACCLLLASASSSQSKETILPSLLKKKIKEIYRLDSKTEVAIVHCKFFKKKWLINQTFFNNIIYFICSPILFISFVLLVFSFIAKFLTKASWAQHFNLLDGIIFALSIFNIILIFFFYSLFELYFCPPIYLQLRCGNSVINCFLDKKKLVYQFPFATKEQQQALNKFLSLLWKKDKKKLGWLKQLDSFEEAPYLSLSKLTPFSQKTFYVRL